jgi:hypothetical protein
VPPVSVIAVAMRYGATIRDRGTWEHAGWAGR